MSEHRQKAVEAAARTQYASYDTFLSVNQQAVRAEVEPFVDAARPHHFEEFREAVDSDSVARAAERRTGLSPHDVESVLEAALAKAQELMEEEQ